MRASYHLWWYLVIGCVALSLCLEVGNKFLFSLHFVFLVLSSFSAYPGQGGSGTWGSPLSTHPQLC